MQLSDELLELLMQEISPEYRVINSKEGTPVFELNGYFTNSKYNPLNEARRFAESNFKENHIHVLLGIGAGYIAEELYQRIGAGERLLIIEPNVQLFEDAYEINGFSFTKDKEKVKTITGIPFEQMDNYLRVLVDKFNNRLQLLIAPNYENIYPLFVKQVMMHIKELLMLQTVKRNTLKTFYEGWQENFISNLYNVFSSTPFSNLIGQIKSPIIIVSGGPSLKKHMDCIKENRERLILLCAGSTINSLLANNIKPDAIVSIDGGYENYKHFENLGQLDVPILYAPILHKDILKVYQGRKIVFNQRGDFKNINLIKNIIGYEIGRVSGGPSVANFCLDIAMQITSGPICFVGQDLAYTNNSSHAEGNKRFKEISEKDIKERKMFYTEGYYGEEVLTDFPLYSMKKTFEGYMKLCNSEESKRVYNCTEGGALIKGFTNIPFSTFINEYCKTNVSDLFDSLLYKLEVKKEEEQWAELFYFVERERNKSKKVNKLCKVAMNKLNDANRVPSKLNYDLLKQLDRLDEELMELLNNEFLNYLYGEIVFNINNYFLEKKNESESENQKRIFEKSYALYKGIYSATKKSIDWFNDLLERISNQL